MQASLDRFLRGRFVVYGVQIALICALVAVAAWVSDLSDQNEEEQATVTAVAGMLATACDAASFRDLQRQGLVEECRLARAGDIDEAIPEEKLPAPDAKPTDVEPDVVPDGPGRTSSSLSVADAQVQGAVDRWFSGHDLPLSGAYGGALRRSVADYLSKNPPRRGRPPSEDEISRAVTAALVADPPAPGENGEDGASGRGVTSAVIDGCDVVFTYTDGSTSRVGPLCGANGQNATPEQIAAAVADYCADGRCRGPQGEAGPAGPAGYPDSITLSDGQVCTDPDGDTRYDCAYQGPPEEPIS